MPNLRSIPADEREPAMHVFHLLSRMSHFYTSLRDAVALYWHCQRTWKADNSIGSMHYRWMWTAARDGGMALYHYGVALEAARNFLYLSPTVESDVDKATMKACSKEFERHFPFSEKVRHAIAHAADNFGTLKKAKENAARSSYKRDFVVVGEEAGATGAAIIQEALSDHRFLNSISGSIVEYAVTEETVATVLAITVRFYSAFARRQS
jgi:hypothetical protein